MRLSAIHPGRRGLFRGVIGLLLSLSFLLTPWNTGVVLAAPPVLNVPVPD